MRMDANGCIGERRVSRWSLVLLESIEFDDKVNIAYGLITIRISAVDRLCFESKPYVQVFREICTDAWYTPV